MTTKEVAGKANVILEHGKSHDWTEDEVKRLIHN